MKEISLNILDITENSLKAESTFTEIIIEETAEMLTFTIKDNGYGMTENVLKTVQNPFYTTRTTRKVGMGIPLLKLATEQTGGSFEITSKSKETNPTDHGTIVKATFNTSHIDCMPLGDIVQTLLTLIQGHPDTDISFTHIKNGKTVSLNTLDLRNVLEGVPLDSYEVIKWIEEYLNEQYSLIFN